MINKLRSCERYLGFLRTFKPQFRVTSSNVSCLSDPIKNHTTVWVHPRCSMWYSSIGPFLKGKSRCILILFPLHRTRRTRGIIISLWSKIQKWYWEAESPCLAMRKNQLYTCSIFLLENWMYKRLVSCTSRNNHCYRYFISGALCMYPSWCMPDSGYRIKLWCPNEVKIFLYTAHICWSKLNIVFDK